MDPRSFLESYQVTDIEKDPLPIKVLRNAITKEEIPGQAVHWSFEYLDQRSCPLPLINHINEKLYQEVQQTDFSHCAEDTGDSIDGGDNAETGARYEPLKLMRAIVNKLDEICLKEREDYHDSVDGIVESPDMLPHVYAVSYNNIKNSRRFMEDRMTVLPRMDRVFKLPTPVSYFAVFDGHNGSEAAAYGAAQLHQYLIQSMNQQQDIIPSISDAFESLDEVFIQKCRSGKVKSGSTVVLSLIMPQKLYVAWLGDSQAVLVKQGEVNNLVTPHKPERKDEIDRIRSSGGEVIQMHDTYRVNGNLAVSRAIGDADQKAFIISTPDIKMLELDGTEEFLILACDGLWDEISPEAAAQIVRRQVVSDPTKVSAVTQKLIQLAKQRGSQDNISVIVVFLEPMESIKNRYEGLLDEETEIEFANLKPSPEPIGVVSMEDVVHGTHLVNEMNGHGKDGDHIVDYLSFGSSEKSGAQLIGDEGENQSGDDFLDKKEVEEDLSDAESDDEWQFEKPSDQGLNATVITAENGFSKPSDGNFPYYEESAPEQQEVKQLDDPFGGISNGTGDIAHLDSNPFLQNTVEEVGQINEGFEISPSESLPKPIDLGIPAEIPLDTTIVKAETDAESNFLSQSPEPIGVSPVDQPNEVTPLDAEMNGHVKEGNQLIDFLSFGSSERSGAQLLGAGDQIVDATILTDQFGIDAPEKNDVEKELSNVTSFEDLQMQNSEIVPQQLEETKLEDDFGGITNGANDFTHLESNPFLQSTVEGGQINEGFESSPSESLPKTLDPDNAETPDDCIGKMQLETDCTILQQSPEPAGGLSVDELNDNIIQEHTNVVADMNGHAKEEGQLLDFNTFGGSEKAEAEVIGKDEESPLVEDVLDKNVMEMDLSTPKPFADLQSEKSEDVTVNQEINLLDDPFEGISNGAGDTAHLDSNPFLHNTAETGQINEGFEISPSESLPKEIDLGTPAEIPIDTSNINTESENAIFQQSPEPTGILATDNLNGNLKQEAHEIMTNTGITETNGPLKEADQIVDLLSADSSQQTAEQYVDEVGGNQSVNDVLVENVVETEVIQAKSIPELQSQKPEDVPPQEENLNDGGIPNGSENVAIAETNPSIQNAEEGQLIDGLVKIPLANLPKAMDLPIPTESPVEAVNKPQTEVKPEVKSAKSPTKPEPPRGRAGLNTNAPPRKSPTKPEPASKARLVNGKAPAKAPGSTAPKPTTTTAPKPAPAPARAAPRATSAPKTTGASRVGATTTARSVPAKVNGVDSKPGSTARPAPTSTTRPRPATAPTVPKPAAPRTTTQSDPARKRVPPVGGPTTTRQPISRPATAGAASKVGGDTTSKPATSLSRPRPKPTTTSTTGATARTGTAGDVKKPAAPRPAPSTTRSAPTTRPPITRTGPSSARSAPTTKSTSTTAKPLASKTVPKTATDNAKTVPTRTATRPTTVGE